MMKIDTVAVRQLDVNDGTFELVMVNEDAEATVIHFDCCTKAFAAAEALIGATIVEFAEQGEEVQ